MNEALIVPSSEIGDASPGLSLPSFINIVVETLAQRRVGLLVMVDKHDT